MFLEADTAVAQRLGFDRPEAYGNRLQYALLDERNDFINTVRRAPCGKLQPPEELCPLDPQVLPRADRRRLVMAEQGNRVLLEVRELPARRFNDVAHAVLGFVGQHEL
jgi:hypothetical protein